LGFSIEKNSPRGAQTLLGTPKSRISCIQNPNVGTATILLEKRSPRGAQTLPGTPTAGIPAFRFPMKELLHISWLGGCSVASPGYPFSISVAFPDNPLPILLLAYSFSVIGVYSRNRVGSTEIAALRTPWAHDSNSYCWPSLGLRNPAEQTSWEEASGEH